MSDDLGDPSRVAQVGVSTRRSNPAGGRKAPLAASAARRTLSERSTLVDYNKSDKPGRKLAHINVLSDSRDELLREMNRLQESIYPEGRVNFVGGRHSAA